MTSLSDTYERRTTEVGRRRLVLGTGLFAAGALLLVAGIVTGATPVLQGVLGVYGSRELAGVLAGLGLPAVFLGVFTVLPANQTYRAAAAVGGGVTILGVALFRHAYPGQWYAGSATSTPSTLVLATTVVYFAGIIVTFWCLFTAVATFKTRNDPGGTVSLSYTEGGETKTVEVAAEDADVARKALGGSGGSVGVAAQFDDTVPTQTGATSDGGTSTDDVRGVDDAMLVDEDAPGSGGSMATADRYCGNCEHFQYVRTDSGIQPYCGEHDELMDDMEACETWTPNRDDAR